MQRSRVASCLSLLIGNGQAATAPDFREACQLMRWANLAAVASSGDPAVSLHRPHQNWAAAMEPQRSVIFRKHREQSEPAGINDTASGPFSSEWIRIGGSAECESVSRLGKGASCTHRLPEAARGPWSSEQGTARRKGRQQICSELKLQVTPRLYHLRRLAAYRRHPLYSIIRHRYRASRHVLKCADFVAKVG